MLLFDLGGVLVHTRGVLLGQRAAGAGRAGAELDDQAPARPMAQLSLGAGLRTGAHHARRSSRPASPRSGSVSVSPDAFLQDLAGWIEQPYPGAEELLAELRREHHVSCFTNCNELHWGLLAPFLSNFDFVVLVASAGADQARRGRLSRGAAGAGRRARRRALLRRLAGQRDGGARGGHQARFWYTVRTRPAACCKRRALL